MAVSVIPTLIALVVLAVCVPSFALVLMARM